MGAVPFLLAALVALPSVLTLAIVVVNRWTWRRPAPLHEAPRAAVSVLVPARNEARQLSGLVDSILAGSSDADSPVAELIVCDDASTDGSDAVLAALASRHSRLRVLPGAPLAPGWVGKPHACHQLAAAATSDLLLYVDADVRLRPGAVAGLVAELHRHPGADVVTAVPRQAMPTRPEGLLMPLLHLSYTAWLPLALIPAVTDPRVLAANGQVLLVRRAALHAIGGWASVRGEVVDDMALCRRVKQAGGRVVFVDGFDLADCRMYDGLQSLVAGFSKNLYEGVGGTPLALLLVVAAHLWAWVLPWVLLPVGVLRGAPAVVAGAALGIAAGLSARALLAERFGHPWWSVPLHPVAILGFVGIAARSMAWSRSGRIAWAGRSYPARAARIAAEQP